MPRAKGPLADKKAFLIEMERPDTADRFSMIYVPIALAASIILALVARSAGGSRCVSSGRSQRSCRSPLRLA